MVNIFTDQQTGKLMMETINNMMLELYASMAEAEQEKKEKERCSMIQFNYIGQ